MFGDGNQTRDWVEVTDIVSALYMSLEYKNKYEIFGLGSNTKTTLNMLFNYFKELTGFAGSPEHLEERDGDIKHMVMTYDYAKEELGWQPYIDLKDGIKKLIDGSK